MSTWVQFLLVLIVTPRPNGPPVTTHEDCRLAPQTNTSLSSALWPHSCAPRKTSQEVTHPKIAPHQARLTVEFLANELPWKHLVDMSSLSILFQAKYELLQDYIKYVYAKSIFSMLI